MKILFCTQCEISKELGGARVAMEIAEAMAPLGWQCELKAIPEIHASYCAATKSEASSAEAFRHFVRENADQYDVIDFDYIYLPFARSESSPRTLLVARSVLLVQHLSNIRLRNQYGLLGQVKEWIRELGNPPAQRLKAIFEAGNETLRQADLVNVPTQDDRILLESQGIATDKIVVFPFGISWEKWPRLPWQEKEASPPTLVFVGSFDHRKGCLDLVDIARRAFAALPGCRLRLLGTRGMLETEAQVRSFFPVDCQSSLEIVPHYAAQDLRRLLQGATLGLFPSYLEGFGMGVIEMVASGVPVLAYTVPGPSTILPPQCLSPRGQWQQMAGQAIHLLQHAGERQLLATQCWDRCQQFDWKKIGRATSEAYRQALEKLRA